HEIYAQKEAEYPVMAGLYHFTMRDAGGHKRYDRESLVDWARERFEVELSLEDLKNKQRDEIRDLLVNKSREHAGRSEAAMATIEEHLDDMVAEADTPSEMIKAAAGSGRLKTLSDWIKAELDSDFPPEEMARLTPERLRRHLTTIVEEKYRPEMRKMERSLVLQLLDTAWKDHLLAMDHLKSSIGLRGYAQVDPKVEYKREGMRTFEAMWVSVGERVTDLVFRMEQLDEGFVGSTWTESEAIHEDAASAGEIAEQQQVAIDGMQTDRKPEPIRNREQRVGRNSPCPCGSGKKFKNCCMRKDGGAVA
ncbi:MAG: SEC-C metal-binding domain-containing protein, partial [Planctomycetota bacterium]|nr:SEC-C metal-binding domain-containing protein [Planctomycetota bacterium]